MSADSDKNYMIDEKEAMSFFLKWSKWGLNQVLAAWDYIFSSDVTEKEAVNFLDEVVFGNLQGLFDGSLDLSKITEELGSMDIDSMMKGDL
mmetsp:Transcript_62544/g.135528  ORF Transcript_62544/g.135528 Transcript_62544/m.135528 type:complete len:91 (+) Transcript_62544:971-1243(+)|eukprot:CAMPEP_0116894448 /NCGR_PEP_ID=MMETSP0467-20121206/4221_1 /TAXON_ID=283647 /ORGANISM="Mesodinium pulex, Strain SPMC105" /LENGTH=90 /DNA_ID=CAMNT_0004564687 /DNA_START=967 /DNA_END=1239 /DNA_ORIENTATION=-